MFDIEFSKNFAKALDKLPDDLVQITHNPFPSNVALDVKKLQGKRATKKQ